MLSLGCRILFYKIGKRTMKPTEEFMVEDDLEEKDNPQDRAILWGHH